MAFYDIVKDRVKNEGKEVAEGDDGKDKKKGDEKVAFDQLIKDSKDRKRDLEPEDEDTIEDFSGKNGGGRSGDYGDLSKIEMGSNSSPQAGKTSEKTSKEGTKGVKKSMREKVGISHGSGKTSPENSEEEVMLTAGGEVKNPEEESAEEAGSTEKALLRQIRDQNREVVKLLRSIDSKLD